MTAAPEIIARRICWPRPSADCLRGACQECNRYVLRTMLMIVNYARLSNRLPALREGVAYDFHGSVEVLRHDPRKGADNGR